MPFLGRRNGTIVFPDDVDDNAIVKCPSCEGEMGVRKSYFNQGQRIRRHFAHIQDADGCGGESAIHQQMKGLAAKELKDVFSHGTVTLEKGIAEGRIADVLVEFPEPQIPYGHGIACEVQHKHKDKDTGSVTYEYLNEGYTIIWAYQSDFDFKAGHFDIPKHRSSKPWPDAMPTIDDREDADDYHAPDMRPVEDRPDDPPGQVPVQIPAAVLMAHQFDIDRPDKVDFSGTEGWQRHDRRSIHKKGTFRLYASIYGHDDVGSILEFQRVNTNTGGQDWLPVPIAPDDQAAYEAFCEKCNAMIRDDDLDYADAVDVINASVELTFNTGIQGQLLLVGTPDREIEIHIKQTDMFGMERRFRIPYRDGDFTRLGDFVPILENVYEPQFPLLSQIELPEQRAEPAVAIYKLKQELLTWGEDDK